MFERSVSFGDKQWNAAVAVMLAMLAFVFGFYSELLNLSFFGMIVFAVVAGFILSLPFDLAIRILFVYLGFEGMAKMVTRYNPVVHVGADLIVVSLVLRWAVSWLLQRTRLPTFYPPLITLFFIHLAWFFVEFANPYSLGLVPSLAGAKMYVTMLLLYVFGFYLSSSRRKVEWFMAIWVFTLAVQAVTSLYQAKVGPASVLWISPYYAAALAKFTANFAFRPFGTTNLAGAPAIYTYLAMVFVVYFLFSARSTVTRVVMALLLPAATAVLLLCQVRSALLKAIIGISFFLLILLGRASAETRRRAVLLAPVAVAALFFILPQITSKWTEDRTENAIGIERTLTLFDFERIKEARGGALNRIITFAEQVPLGAGLSRTGAAAEKFGDLIWANPYFSQPFFADNFWAATIAEVGIPGSLILTTIILSILFRGLLALRSTPDPDRRMLQAALLCPLIAIFIGLWGAEGLLYNPEAAFFWFFSGALVRLTLREDVSEQDPVASV